MIISYYISFMMYFINDTYTYDTIYNIISYYISFMMYFINDAYAYDTIYDIIFINTN